MRYNKILNEKLEELIEAFNSDSLIEWLEAEALEINAEEKEILLAYGGYTLWLDLNNGLIVYHYGDEERSLQLSNDLNTTLLHIIKDM